MLLRPTLGLVLLAGLAAAQFQAGAAKRKITPDLKAAPAYLAGFGQNRLATGIHDDLWVRCIAIESGRRLVICGVDSIGLFYDDVERIRDQAVEKLGAPAEIVIAATHCHQTPDTMGLWGPSPGQTGINEEYNLFLIERAAEAVAEAVKNMRPAEARLAKTRTTELDSFVADTRPPVVLDTEVVALALTSTNGKRIATLVNWANHPEVLGSKNTQVTADYLASFYARMEKRAGGLAVFVNGALGGMMSPLGAKVAGAPEESFKKAEIIGTRLAEAAHAALKNAPTVHIETINFREQIIEIPVANKQFHAAAKAGLFKGRKEFTQGAVRAPVGFFRLSSGREPVLECALIPGELYPELSVGGIERFPGADYRDAPLEPAIKQSMKAPFRMLIGLANDENGYIIPKAEWDEKEPWLKNAQKRWYGEVNSVGPEAAPLIVRTVRELLRGGDAGK